VDKTWKSGCLTRRRLVSEWYVVGGLVHTEPVITAPIEQTPYGCRVYIHSLRRISDEWRRVISSNNCAL